MPPRTPKRQKAQSGVYVAVLFLLFLASSCVSTCARADVVEPGGKTRASSCFQLELPAGPWRLTLNLCPGEAPVIGVDADPRAPHPGHAGDTTQGDPLEVEVDPDPEP